MIRTRVCGISLFPFWVDSSVKSVRLKCLATCKRIGSMRLDAEVYLGFITRIAPRKTLIKEAFRRSTCYIANSAELPFFIHLNWSLNYNEIFFIYIHLIIIIQNLPKSINRLDSKMVLIIYKFFISLYLICAWIYDDADDEFWVFEHHR